MLQATVAPPTGTPPWVTRMTRGAGNGALIVPAWLLPETIVMTRGGAVAVAVKVTEAPGTAAVTWVVGPVGVSVLLVWPLVSVTDVGAARVPLPEVRLQVAVGAPTGE